ncbi:Haloacid dehalogenase-like hydrolase [Trachipleistophora hominis]|uniref:Haloacid dehalogenase-like hydrolase n=1 Tax=Trachipleistophora hominis TaxID=72359 RepID=L7JXH3_TRAHO|nr:Haloacid dehalogenase-like hydrolase [Trachipleistophora hominis]
MPIPTRPQIIPMSTPPHNHQPPIHYPNLFIFDIDNTLYHSKPSLTSHITTQALSKLSINHSAARQKILRECREQYGFSIKGLYARNLLDYDTYCEVIDGVDYGAIVGCDGDLKSLLGRLDAGKICFTNGERMHCMRVLDALGISDAFDYVVCVDHKDPDFLCKPMEQAFDLLERLFSVKNMTVFFDDDPRNIAVAEQRGWNAHCVSSVQEMKALLVNTYHEYLRDSL